MNAVLDAELRAAVGVMHRSRWRKLLKPGPLPFVARTLQKWRGTPSERVVRLFFGAPMHVVLPEIVSETIYTYGFFDEHVSYMFLASIEPGQTVLDVGAHFGYFSLLASEIVGPSGSVHAFEPTRSTYRVASENLQGRANVQINNAAAGEEDGRLEMLDFGVRYSAFNSLSSDLRDPTMKETIAAERVTVPVQRLDRYVQQRALRPAFIKIDAENFEEQVVKGLQETVAAFHPKILLETGSESSRRAGAQLTALGYQVWTCPQVGRLERWTDSVEVANARHKDLLFVHHAPGD